MTNSSPFTDVARYFSASGRLNDSLPGEFEERPQQVAMARSVADVVNNGGRLLIEAGTGTGKTLAYLVPICRDPKLRVVVSTATKALQEQIMNKDLLLLEEALGCDVDTAVIKGRRNYLCQRQMKLAQGTKWSKQELEEFKIVLDWQRQTRTGDFAEISGVAETSRIWSRLSSGGEDCYGQHCPYTKDCWANLARARAKDAQLIIVNHHLFLADIALQEQDIKGPIPKSDFVVFDEAHRLEDAATAFFSESLYFGRSKRVVDRLNGIRSTKVSIGAFRESARNMHNYAVSFFSDLKKKLGKLFGNIALDDLSAAQRKFIDEHVDTLGEKLSALRTELRDLGAKDAFGSGDYQVLEKLVAGIQDTVDWIQSDAGNSVVYVVNAKGDKRLPRIVCSPVDVGSIFEDVLYPRAPNCIFVSATLAVDSSMYYTRQRLALGPKDCKELILDSPFDHRQQTVLYVSRELPEPRDKQFLSKAAAQVKDIIGITEGRAFILCTSYRAMNYLHTALKDSLPYQILVQGELQKAELLKRFQDRPSVLFATTSFWEGVDVAHAALSLVVIDKLPFAVPTDPLERARFDLLTQWGANAFTEYTIPRTALALKQGFGRLIRRRTDRGVVAILDNRLLNKWYGKTMLRTLPECSVAETISDLKKWF